MAIAEPLTIAHDVIRAYKTYRIANGATAVEIELGPGSLLGIELPAVVTGTNFAITVLGRDGNYKTLPTLYGTYTAGNNLYLVIDPAASSGWGTIKITMDAQGQDTDLVTVQRTIA